MLSALRSTASLLRATATSGFPPSPKTTSLWQDVISALPPLVASCHCLDPRRFKKEYIPLGKYPTAMDEPPLPLGGGVLQGTGLYSLQWPVPWPVNHPSFDTVLGDECVALMSLEIPKWLHRFTMSEFNLNGDKIGAGHRFMVEFSPPHNSPYYGMQYIVEIRPCEDYPNIPPFIRFVTSIDHVLVHEYGDLKDCFYLEANLKWSQVKPYKGFLHILSALRRMLVKLPEHLVLTSDELQRVCLTNAPHLVGRREEDTSMYEGLYMKSLPDRQRELDEIARQKIYTLKNYKPLYPDLFVKRHFAWDRLKGDIFHPRLLRALNAGDEKRAVKVLVKQECKGVYSFPMFTEDFCDKLYNEIENLEASGLPKVGPNSMNNHGVILNQIGMEKFMDHIMWKVLKLFGDVFFEEHNGEWLDHHHTFVVKYKKGEDEHLEPHMDDSEVTLNVCLGSVFEGGRLLFCGELGKRNHRVVSTTYPHRKGIAVVHAGRHRHGALNLEAGERMNLVMWGRSSRFRRGGLMFELKRHANEETPDIMCVSSRHDKDYEKRVKYHLASNVKGFQP
ncbi:hypothetical protein BSKO_07921 [Bryopsis sp. KO-2023]|nr:hypothetical protein BSKO_07921 [Bryopsis sp. KO-2023]